MSRKFISVKIPASSGNIGPGYDVLGCALGLYNEIKVRVLDPKPGAPFIRPVGEGALSLPIDKTNLVFRAIERVYKEKKKKVPQLEILCLNNIPLARGLGSSSTAIVGGLLAGNKLLKNPFTPRQILALASDMEGHPDNAAPALFGGVQASRVQGKDVLVSQWPSPKAQVVVAIPSFELSTKKARAVLPRAVSMKAAVSNLSSVALLPEAFKSHPEWIGSLLNDELHEPFRAKLIPGFKAVKSAALRAGAYGVALSGAGPTIMAFIPKNKGRKVGKAMVNAFRKSRVKSQFLVLSIPRRGALVR